ncbi:UNVERIFIED_CONTAM: hypothetical protein GTU68_053572 [Idotea baltica]|nr:hypothetical protein [Idotea baltica]
MSSLTEEQRKKIEENRRKALEKRAALLKSRSNNNVDKGGSSSGSIPFSNGNKPPLFNSTNSAPKNSEPNWTQPSFNAQPKLTNFLSNSASVNKNSAWKSGGKEGKPNWSQQPSLNLQSKPSSFYSNQSSTQKDSGGNVAKPVFTGKKVTGNFLLSCKDTFEVNVPYNQQVIDIFKTMPSKQYDVKTKKWSFNISDHSRLSTALNQLRPAVCISDLPSYVLQALKKSSKYPTPASIDLLSLDPLLLEAFMPFQREGVCFGVSRGGRVLIADDMGLGKTVQALGIASYYRNEWPMLVVTPSSVRYSWAEAVDRWVGSVDAYEVMVVNTGKDCLEGTVIIMSYDLLSRRAKEIKDMNFQVVIMDESHMLKNFKSIRYKSAYPVMKSAKRLILLSGTPALSRPSELYTQISAIDSRLIPK